ncbi:YhhA family cyclophane-containing RiPP [Pseudomonas chlororaphis]|uniref:YhhA family cyclophane-containing RiPP n=1 Tax=Pseudomonas chlororaphis TaxID=587753 RepID=UPI003A0FD43E
MYICRAGFGRWRSAMRAGSTRRDTMSNAVRSTESVGSEIRSALARKQVSNPAIQRLKARVLSEADASQVITSYDRMHHRHNRS